MKTVFLGLTIVMGAASIHAQGTVILNNHVGLTVVAHIYSPLAANPYLQRSGNGPADVPAGTQDWSGFTLIGANGSDGPFGAAGTFAQLLGASGYNQPESSLVPAIPTTTFRTGIAAGYLAARTATFSNIPYISEATVQLVVWDNSSGLYPTWSEASTAWDAGLIAGARSVTMNVQTSTPLGIPPWLEGLQSFNLYYIPEPTAFTLIGLAAGLGLWLRCKVEGAKPTTRLL